MKITATLVVAGFLAGALGATAQAQAPAPSPATTSPETAAPPSAPSATTGDAEAFERYLHAHPALDAELTRDPSLVRDKAYIEKHPKLKSYLQAHPKIAAEFRDHPSEFMERAQKTQGGHGPY